MSAKRRFKEQRTLKTHTGNITTYVTGMDQSQRQSFLWGEGIESEDERRGGKSSLMDSGKSLKW